MRAVTLTRLTALGRTLGPRVRLAFAAALLGALPFLVYANNYRHDYLLDDAYTVATNPSVRSLSNIPRYFVDPGTYTSLREQADYRPVLQVTYALNYRMGGYDTWWWHFTQVALHALVTLGLFALARRVLGMAAVPHAHVVAFIAALIFAVHPAASGVVNYFNARSSLLTAAFLLPALVAYATPIERDGYARPRWLAAGAYALALFTKVEAVGVLGAFWAYELWQRAREQPALGILGAARRSLDARTIRRLAPALVVTLVYFVIRWRVMAPFPFDETRHAADVGPYQYFLTQLTAWWYYLLRWVAPVRLVADYLAYPVYRSWTEPVVLLAVGGWAAVATALIAVWRRAPHLLFLTLAALALLSPTSSVAPLAEMVNEHRPYLPVGILSLALILPAAHWWNAQRSAALRVSAAAALFVCTAALGALTYQRNLVFSTSERFWRDVLDKAPSARAHLNYGLARAGANDLDGALEHYRASLKLAPYWYYTHINLGVVYGHLGNADSARAAFDRAVEHDRYSGHALTWRAEYRLTSGDFAGARDDLLRSEPVSLQRYRNTKGLATAYAGLGDVDRALEYTRRLIALDSATALTDIPAISTPFFVNAAHRVAGIDFYRRLEQHLPGTWWIPENIARLERLRGASQPARAPAVTQSATAAR